MAPTDKKNVISKIVSIPPTAAAVNIASENDRLADRHGNHFGVAPQEATSNGCAIKFGFD